MRNPVGQRTTDNDNPRLLQLEGQDPQDGDRRPAEEKAESDAQDTGNDDW